MRKRAGKAAAKRTTESRPERKRSARRTTTGLDELDREIAYLLAEPYHGETAYAVTSFPVKEGQSWSQAAFDAKIVRSFTTLLSRADRWRGGLIVGFDPLSGVVADIGDAIVALPSNALYEGPVSEVKIGDVVRFSERDRADDGLTVLCAVAFENAIGHFLDIATTAAFEAALIVGRDAAQQRNPELRRWWRAHQDMPAVKPATDEERNAFVAHHTSQLRALLTALLFGTTTARTVGRKAEDQRNHRAYCMRQRLVESASSPFAYVSSKHERLRLAKAQIRQEIIGACSDSSWTRIMRSGKAVHERVAPDTPFCERIGDVVPTKGTNNG